jgi:hypothetical protein
LIEIATNAEAQAMTDTTRALVPSNLAALRASSDDIATGTTEQRFITPKTLSDMKSSLAGQLITATDLYTFAHGLGARPSRVDFFLECMTADGGYTGGDYLPMPTHMIHDTGADIRGWAVKMDATNIYLSIDVNDTLTLHEWNGNGTFGINRSSYWKAHFVAYK